MTKKLRTAVVVPDEELPCRQNDILCTVPVAQLSSVSEKRLSEAGKIRSPDDAVKIWYISRSSHYED